jgi:hypothetical protein
MGFLNAFHPIMSFRIKVSHRRLSKAHTCFHHMAPIFKLNMLDCSTIGVRVCFFSQSPLLHLPTPQHWSRGFIINFANLYALFICSLYLLWLAIAIKFCCLHLWCLKGELHWLGGATINAIAIMLFQPSRFLNFFNPKYL